MRVPAIVGAFPEPFLSGSQGKRRPVRVECDDADSSACDDAARRRSSASDVPVSQSSLGAPGTENVTRLVVARWPRARIVRGGSTLEDGPERSGVFARFADDGRALELLDEQGEVARTVRAGDGVGLVLAMRPRADELALARHRPRRARPRGRRAGARRAQPARRVCGRGDRRQGREASPGVAVTLIPAYRSRPSALHTARAGVGAGFCLALALVGALYRHPLILAGALGAILIAGSAAGVGREVAGSLRLAVPFALLVAAVNALVYQEGNTLLLRGGTFLGRRWDVTLEATLEGLMNGMRIVVLISALGGLMSAAVDPDELLKALRRISYRSALTATLATRLVPVLARDAGRMGDAARCRPHPPGRLAVVRAALANSLDRAVEVAAALEVRGYSLAGRPARHRRPLVAPRPAHRRRRARHRRARDRGRRWRGSGTWTPTRRSTSPSARPSWRLASALVLLGAAPLAGRAARLGVVRA